MKLEYIVNKKSILKDYLLEIGLSKKFCRKVKLYGQMYINGVLSKNYFKVDVNDVITIVIDEKENDDIVATSYPLDILYEDEHILIINKPHNLSTQPSKLHYEHNLISYIKSYLKSKNISTNIHVVNRLDYQTSGLMAVCKDGYTHYLLSKENVITRKYYALIYGILEEKSGLIDLKISRKEGNTILREVNENGKIALTKYNVIKEYDNSSLLDITLLTGRTHQIRVHFSHLNHPLIGDKLYGNDNTDAERLMLHSYYISFINPYTKEKIEITKYPTFM